MLQNPHCTDNVTYKSQQYNSPSRATVGGLEGQVREEQPEVVSPDILKQLISAVRTRVISSWEKYLMTDANQMHKYQV